jgi:hypothetical protein
MPSQVFSLRWHHIFGKENKDAVAQLTAASLSSSSIMIHHDQKKGYEMTSIVGEFYGFKLRTPEESDQSTLKRWIAADPTFANRITPKFFMSQQKDESGNAIYFTCVLEDPEGIVFFIRIDRIERAAFVNIQFSPA